MPSYRVPIRMKGGNVRYLNRKDMTRVDDLEGDVGGAAKPQTDKTVARELPGDELSAMISHLSVKPKVKRGRGKVAYV